MRFGPSGLGAQKLAVHARLAQARGDELLRRELVARRVYGVDAQQLDEELGGLGAAVAHPQPRTPSSSASSCVRRWWQAARVPLSRSSSWGSMSEQTSVAFGQRV